jgi:putative ABC transport system permease protein
MVSLARKNLFEDKTRFLVAQAGILFAVSLVTIQTGILHGFTRSTALLITRSRADIWVASKDMANLDLTLPIPYERVSQAQKVAGVARAEAVTIQGGTWRNSNGTIASIRLIGVDPNEQLLTPGTIHQGKLSDLTQPYTVIADQTDLKLLDVKQVGTQAQIGSLQTHLVGLTSGIQSNADSPFLLTSLESAKAYSSSPLPSLNTQPKAPPLKQLSPNDSITYVLVQAKPGQDLQVLKQRLESALPNTRAYTRTEMATQTENYWEKRTSIGFILGLGAIVGVVVGVVIVSQILYASVSDHLREFGTIKAMGASDWKAYRIIVEQALWMAIFGYLPGMALCVGLAAWTTTVQGVIILITPVTAVGVFGITVFMCVGSALVAIQKATRIDPGVVFRG